jgi:hypothetical protein
VLTARDQASPADAAARATLEQVLASGRAGPLDLAFAYDELAGAVAAAALPPPLAQAVAERVEADFEAHFLRDLADLPASQQVGGGAQRSALAAAQWLNLDSDDAKICISVLPALLAAREPRGRAQLAMLPAAFRLLCACERALSGGSLAAVDALLGCPLLLWKPLPPEARRSNGTGVCLGLTKRRVAAGVRPADSAGQGDSVPRPAARRQLAARARQRLRHPGTPCTRCPPPSC